MPSQDEIFVLVQFYGETLQYFISILDEEDKLLEKNHFVPAEVGKLLDLRERRCAAGMALKETADELQEKHGIQISDINGWKLVRGHRFHKEPYPSLHDKLK